MRQLMSNKVFLSYNILMQSDRIKIVINQALSLLQLPEVNYTIEHPQIESHGDYATNVAMVLFPLLKRDGDNTYKNPRELAEKIKETISESKPDSIESIQVAGPGFINFSLSSDVFVKEINTILSQKDQYGKSTALQNKKIVVEYTDPNPFKEFHIGHLYSNIVGETIARILESNGATIWRADYFGDVGMHVAKSIWGLLHKFESEQQSLNSLSQLPLPERIRYLGQAYALGATQYETSEQSQVEIKNLNALLYRVSQRFVQEKFGKPPVIHYPEPSNPNAYSHIDLYELYTVCRQWSLDYFETIYARLGTKFNGYYPESKVGETGYQLVTAHPEFFETGEGGATIFPGKKYGLHDRVFINSLGLPTYECKELGLVSTKYADFPYDRSIIVTGNEINDYFNVLLKAMECVEPDLGKVTEHIGHGMVRLPEGKMSSRTGKVLTGESLLNDAQQASLEIINELNPQLPDKDYVSDIVGLAAIRYALLRTSIGKDVIFNFKESISFSGNSGPYLQYTYARCSSVLIKAGNEASDQLIRVQRNESELSVAKWIARYPETVCNAAESLSPHLLCDYAYELAQRFNSFYNHYSILGNNKEFIEPDIKQSRIQLTAAVRQILKNTLSILGIQVVERM